jgi:hypothetical protein
MQNNYLGVTFNFVKLVGCDVVAVAGNVVTVNDLRYEIVAYLSRSLNRV